MTGKMPVLRQSRPIRRSGPLRVDSVNLRDPVSSASHLVTAVWAVYATLVMCRLTARRPGRRLAVGVYGASMVLLYLASGAFHGLYYSTAEERRLFQKL